MRWLSVLIAVGWASPAFACEFPGPTELEIVANPADETAPSVPKVEVVEVKRGDNWNGDDGCGGGSSSTCTGIAYVKLQLTSTDDVTAPEALGYRIDDPSGRLMGAGRVLALDLDGNLNMYVLARDNGDHDLKFELTVTAVDKAGNESAPTQLTTGSDGSKRCQLAPGIPGGALYTLALLALITRRRRRGLGGSIRGAAGSRS